MRHVNVVYDNFNHDLLMYVTILCCDGIVSAKGFKKHSDFR